MPTFLLIVPMIAAPSSAKALCPDFSLPSGSEIVEIQTNRGQICIELLRAAAPITVVNFQSYAARGDYAGTIIHRSVPGFVIQGGGFAKTIKSLNPVVTDPQIPNEPCTIEPGNTECTVRGNTRGTIAMAKLGGQPNSATSQFFINLVDNDFLDSSNGGFTVFGNVLGPGMTVADDIAALPIADEDEGWWLAPAFGSALTDVPLINPVPFFPTAFGCWDPTNLAIVVDPVFHNVPLPDPIFGTSLYPLSGSCGTQIPRYTFTQDPGPPGCPELDVLTTAVTGPNSLEIVFDPSTTDYMQFEFTCADVAAATAQRSLWRDDLGGRMTPQLVVVQSVNYQPVPEPGSSMALVIGVGSLLGLGRSGRSGASHCGS